jgi:cell pole-organizing protein PopZ
MEEILASIRRIISEDDAPAAEAAAEPEEPVAEAAPEPELPTVPEDEDDGVLELTDKVETLGDLDVYAPAAAEEEPEPDVEAEAFAAPAYTPQPGEGLVGDPAAAAAAAAFGALSSSILMPKDGRTLEDVVRELLRPLLKQWLDANLPGIVEAQVKAEVERISRGGRVG